MTVPDYSNLSKSFFKQHSAKYDLATNEGCGKYTEAFVRYARKIDSRIGHLKKNPGQTQYNGHANDAILYDSGEDLICAVDIIGAAEQPHYWKTEIDPATGDFGTYDPPNGQWAIDIPRYNSSMWLATPITETVPAPLAVPYESYNEQGFERLKRILMHDYARKPQGADFNVTVWAGRYFHNCYMGPEGKPLGEQASLERIKPELCAALGIDNDNYLG